MRVQRLASPVLGAPLTMATALLLGMAAGGESAHAQCAWWDGFRHFSTGGKGMDSPVYAMNVFDADGGGPNPPALYVAGSFGHAGTVPASAIAKWDGSTWSAVGGGIEGPSRVVYALAIHDDGSGPALYAAGQFATAGGAAANSIAKWNGTSWSALGTGFSESWASVYALASFQGSLYAGGYFFEAGGSAATFIARWDGASWSRPDYYGIDGEVFALAVFDGQLYVGGTMHTAGTKSAEGIARWDGTNWSAVGTGLAGYFHTATALRVWNDGAGSALYVGGSFNTAGGVPASCIATWNGGTWSAVGAGVSYPSGPWPYVYAITPFDDGTGPGLCIGGRFTRAGGLTANFIAYQQNTNWSGIGGGMGDEVKALAVFDDDGSGPNPPYLYAGGTFTFAGGTESMDIAKWYDRDSDGDALLDCWETQGKGIDVNHDGAIDLDLYALGARANHKDVFVEVDAMGAALAPAPQAITDVVNAFADVPNELVSNPDGVKGVNLHIDLATMDTDILPATWVVVDARGWPTAFDAAKTSRFGTAAQRGNATVLAAKRLAYRYCIFAHAYGTTSSSGIAEIGGNDLAVTLGLWNPSGGTEDQQAGTFMHELGHTLGLYHGGDQTDATNVFRYNFKPNYHSVMNYTWQVPATLLILPPFTPLEVAYADSWVLDYSRVALTPLAELGLLNEPVGIDGDVAYVLPVGPPPMRFALMTGPVDWDRDGHADNVGATADVNRVIAAAPASLDLLAGHDDWSNLDYNFRDSADFADGVHQTVATSEMTREIFELLASRPNGCATDFDHDQDIDGDDVELFRACATGPAVPYDPEALPAGCTLPTDGEGVLPADLDRDRDVDQTDFAMFQICVVGPPASL